ncbi:MAG: DHH family phosphoesterase, partial [Synergistaceae bacterium]|nr:DHH family phosphoesterase [Synergistaceae bacterium]
MVVFCSQNELNIYSPGPTAVEIAARLDCSLFQAALLEMRGVDSKTSDTVIRNWVSPDMDNMLGSMDLGETNSLAADVFRGLGEGSNVVVYGDYDVDGISATALAVEMALQKKASVRYFIPHRFNQGYGLHSDVAAGIAKRKCDLLIVVDCGTQDVEEVRMIRESGIPVVIVDHHLAEGDLALSDTMVNPQVGGDVTAKRLCAAGVLWCWAWQNELIPMDKLRKLLDLVALATIADCVSLASPLNRVLVREGLEVIRRSPRPGLAILMEKLGINPAVLDPEDLAMKIIPCLNAAGRLYFADLAVKILFNAEDL